MSILRPLIKRKKSQREEPIDTPYGIGLIQDPVDERDYQLSSLKQITSPQSLPYRVDYSNEMSSIKNQGRTPMCVGFAVAATKEWQEQQEYLKEKKQGSKYKRKESHYDLSESWIYWNCKKIDNFPDSGGTNIRSAMKVLNKLGVPQEKAWPFTEDMDNPGKPASWSKMTAKWKKIKSYHRINNTNELLDYLANHGPLVTGVLVFRTFYYPDNSGHVSMPDSNEDPLGGHALAVVGYDRSQNKIFFKNSWGSWGNQGYGSFSFEYWQNYLMDTWALTDIDTTAENLEGKWEGL